MVEFRMPSLGADMEAGTLVEWMVRPGDRVKRGDVVAVVDTQKGAIEVEIFETGAIEKILVDVGAKVPVGTPLAEVRVEGEAVPPPQPAAEAARPAGPAAKPPAPPAAPEPPAPPAPAERPTAETAPRAPGRASPAARKRAEERGIELATVKGTGPDRAITNAEVDAAVAPVPAAPPAAKPKPAIGIDLGQMRVAIAAGMARSKREIPHYYLSHQVDVTAAEAWLAAHNADLPPDARLLFGVLAVKAVALAARRFQAFNGFCRDGRFEPAAAVHVGVAIAIRGGGLVAPAVHDTDTLSLEALMAATRDVVGRARSGRIRSSEIADPTITVSSLGERGVEALFGIIYPPQVAIVGVGKAVRRPWVVDDKVVPRSVIALTLSADHRVSDGHAGAQFLAEIGTLLTEPDKL